MYIEVILPLPISGTFTYFVNKIDENKIKIGIQVIVEFQSNKIYIGIVESIIDNITLNNYSIKSIISILGKTSIIHQYQLQIWNFIKQYYCCSLGTIYRNTFPSALRLSNYILITINNENNINLNFLNKKNKLIVEHLLNKKITSIKKLELLVSKQDLIESLKYLYNKKFLNIIRNEKFKKKINKNYEKRKNIKSHLIFDDHYKITNYINKHIHLNKNQEIANNQINNFFKNYSNILLYSINFASKTEIYLHQIYKFFNNNQQVLILVPQVKDVLFFFEKIKEIFKSNIAIYHSKLSNNKKANIWIDCLKDKYKIIIGTRSAIFLPLNKLQLIIIDNEHHNAYKQKKMIPYYHSRNLAWYIVKIKKIFCLIGSDTPSLETYYYSKIGKIKLIKLTNEFNKINNPKIEIINLKNNHKYTKLKISNSLKEEIYQSLQNNNQVFILVNKNDFFYIIQCQTCNYIPICKYCNIELIYHKLSNNIKCKYCNYVIIQINRCKICNNDNIIIKKLGIEQIEKELKILFYHYKIKAIDNNLIKKKYYYEQIIQEIKLKKINIIISTQINNICFKYINLIGIINSDSLLYISNFRALEYTVQIIIQIAKILSVNNLQNKILIQTFSPDSEFYKNIKNYNLSILYQKILKERKLFFYPPFSRLIEITIKNQNSKKNHSILKLLINDLCSKISNDNILGPIGPKINQKNNLYISVILIKISRMPSSMQTRNFIYDKVNQFKKKLMNKKELITINVDPY